MIDRMTLVARLQVQWRATVVAEVSSSWIVVVAEGAYPVAKIRGARGVGPGGGGWRAHAGILSCRKEFALGFDESATAWPRSLRLRFSQRNRTKAKDCFRAIWAARLTGWYW